ncbi:hypothetical protein [Tabrizicola sp. YIM 78059]|uniref:hypothetical protein n=1 Tax=Tabrizicola sp. YIM 78059 TaxID=2529861 RepID=UPI0010AA0D25|nr:hypothetical protein [Tabrizicola sp. YIM 78059]
MSHMSLFFVPFFKAHMSLVTKNRGLKMIKKASVNQLVVGSIPTAGAKNSHRVFRDLANLHLSGLRSCFAAGFTRVMAASVGSSV